MSLSKKKMFCYPHITDQHDLQQKWNKDGVEEIASIVKLMNRQWDYHHWQQSEEKSNINTVNLSMLRHLTNQSMIAESHLAVLQAIRLHPFFSFPSHSFGWLHSSLWSLCFSDFAVNIATTQYPYITCAYLSFLQVRIKVFLRLYKKFRFYY